MRGWLIVLVAGVVLAGCAADEPARPVSRTDALRAALDPRLRALLLEGDEAFQQGRYAVALALADSVGRQAPELADVPFFQGNVWMRLNRYADARAAFERVLALDPYFPGAWQRLGDIAGELGQPAEAVRYYRKEAALAPRSEVYEKLGVVYAEAGVPDSARWAYDRALELDSTNADAQLLYGQFLEKLGAYEEALVHSRAALALRPDHANYRFAVGAQLYRTGRLEEARRYLQQAADALPLHYPAQYNLGQVLLRLGREDEARVYLARADTARVLMADITATEEAVARDPDAPAIWVHLGRLYHRAGVMDRAEEAFARAEALAPDNLDARSGLARIAMANGRTNEAIQRFSSILKADPRRIDDRLALGLAYAVTGDCSNAREAWNGVLRQQPDHPTARGYLDGLCAFQAPP
ncbi:MAG: tetratricopeptide repeat protein [Rhodothermales bacterium]